MPQQIRGQEYLCFKIHPKTILAGEVEHLTPIYFLQASNGQENKNLMTNQRLGRLPLFSDRPKTQTW